MLCTTCHGKGYIMVPYIKGVVSAQYPCPACHAGEFNCCGGDDMPIPPSYEPQALGPRPKIEDIINSDTVWKGEDEWTASPDTLGAPTAGAEAGSKKTGPAR